MSTGTRVPWTVAALIAEELAKVCTVCKVSLPMSSFWKDRTRSDGRYPTCKDCSNAVKRSAYAANPEPKRSRNRTWLKENAECFAAYASKWHQENRGRRLLAQTARRSEKRDAITAYERLWRESNREKRRAAVQRYRRSHLIGDRERVARRKALIRSVTVERVDYEAILDRDGWVCHLCRLPISNRSDLHFDHIVPLARGGLHEPGNIAPSHVICNTRKGAR